ncbi:eukaryotic mitochondrial regulator protein-domain-containing protein [Powellomyces hirtus]|nr:eukaryotic mitochondrial regulator protein-domain-containing protein [Powellomyces hirtus]
MNPFFRPQAPLSNATRSEVFKLYLEDAQQWTPRALAEHFGLSIVRVQAILRLKALEQKWEAEGKPIQTNLTNGMELMLNAQTLQTLPNTRPREKLRLTSAKRLQPFFRMINEEEAFTPEDAAALMKLEPFANLQRKLDEAADHVFELEPRAAAAPKTISVDPSLKSRFQFMLVDTGNPEKTRIMVRERNGRLRGATVEERFRRKNLKPRYFM